VFINITNDSWSKTKSAELQHFAVASFRAIEMRTTLVRSTNSGYSTVVNPAGKILYDMPLFTADSLYAEVPVYKREMTPYALLGNWIPLLCGVFLFASFIVSVFLKFKEDHE
jgi:apolipoprotein N-acyltransferase